MGSGMGGRGEGDVFVWGNFSSGKFGSWKRQAARSQKRCAVKGLLLRFLYRFTYFQIRNEKCLHIAPSINNYCQYTSY